MQVVNSRYLLCCCSDVALENPDTLSLFNPQDGKRLLSTGAGQPFVKDFKMVSCDCSFRREMIVCGDNDNCINIYDVKNEAIVFVKRQVAGVPERVPVQPDSDRWSTTFFQSRRWRSGNDRPLFHVTVKCIDKEGVIACAGGDSLSIFDFAGKHVNSYFNLDEAGDVVHLGNGLLSASQHQRLEKIRVFDMVKSMVIREFSTKEFTESPCAASKSMLEYDQARNILFFCNGDSIRSYSLREKYVSSVKSGIKTLKHKRYKFPAMRFQKYEGKLVVCGEKKSPVGVRRPVILVLDPSTFRCVGSVKMKVSCHFFDFNFCDMIDLCDEGKLAFSIRSTVHLLNSRKISRSREKKKEKRKSGKKRDQKKEKRTSFENIPPGGSEFPFTKHPIRCLGYYGRKTDLISQDIIPIVKDKKERAEYLMKLLDSEREEGKRVKLRMNNVTLLIPPTLLNFHEEDGGVV